MLARGERGGEGTSVEYCLGDGNGLAEMFAAEPTVDLDGDGVPDAVGFDVDADGMDDALVDVDGDGRADQLVVDVGSDEDRFTDDGSGTWAVSADRGAQLRWLGLDGVAAQGGPLVDFDGDGQADDRLLDADRDGSADRVFAGERAYVDTDGDGSWDVVLSDADGDGAADAAGPP